MSTDVRGLAEVEKLVLDNSERIARLKARMDAIRRAGKEYSPDARDLLALELEKAALVDRRDRILANLFGNQG